MDQKNESDIRLVRIGLSKWDNTQPLCLDTKYNCNPGFELDILKTLGQLLNFKFEVKISNETGCGYQTYNDTWTGLMGMLHRNEVDITGNLCAIDSRRSNVTWLDHTVPVFQDEQAFLLKAPQPVFAFYIAAPFHWMVWYIIALFILLFLFLFAFSTLIRYHLNFFPELAGSFQKIVILSAGMDIRNIDSLQHMYLIFFGIITVFYSSFIKGALINPIVVSKPMSNYKEAIRLLSTGEYKILTYDKPASLFGCFDDCDKLVKAYEKHGYEYVDPRTYDFQSSFLNKLIENERLVFIDSEVIIRFYLDQFKDRSKLWLIVDNQASQNFLAYFYNADFKYRRELNVIINMLGSYKDNIRLQLYPLSKQAIVSSYIEGAIPEATPISSNLLVGPFLMYTIGIFISFVALVIETLQTKVQLDYK